MRNWVFKSTIKSFCPASLSSSTLCNVRPCYQEACDSGTSKTSPKHVPNNVSSEVHLW